jgi:hypothetical protein
VTEVPIGDGEEEALVEDIVRTALDRLCEAAVERGERVAPVMSLDCRKDFSVPRVRQPGPSDEPGPVFQPLPSVMRRLFCMPMFLRGAAWHVYERLRKGGLVVFILEVVGGGGGGGGPEVHYEMFCARRDRWSSFIPDRLINIAMLSGMTS